MSNEIVKWDEELAKYANKAAAQERPAVGRLAFRAGVMTYQGQPIPGNKLETVIIASAKEHALYANVLENRQFDPNNPESPVCYALSLDGENMAPHAQVKQKRATDCANCAFNAWGSDPKGGRGKACKEVRRLIVIPKSAVVAPPGQQLPADSVKKSESASCNIPVTSVKNWANYTALLAAQFRRPAWAVVTEISVTPNPKTMFEVKFAVTDVVKDHLLSDLHQLVQSAERLVMTPYSDSTNAPRQQPMQGRKY